MLYIYLGVGIFLIEGILIVVRKNRKKRKGIRGEKQVQNILKSLPRRKYKVLNNVLLTYRKKTSQIDHIVISRYGIFVIETKNYRGRICGDESKEYWTQYLQEEKHSFYSPIRQNRGHVRAISKYTKEYEKLPVVSIIAFSDQCLLDVYSYTDVVYFSQLKQTIRRYRRRRISKSVRDEIYQNISNQKLNTRKDQKEHLVFVKENVRDYQKKIKYRICPRCGGRLVKRRRNHSKVLICRNKKYCNFLLNLYDYNKK